MKGLWLSIDVLITAAMVSFIAWLIHGLWSIVGDAGAYLAVLLESLN